MAGLARSQTDGSPTDVRSLADADPELLAGIPDADRALARRALAWRVRTIAQGECTSEVRMGRASALGALIVEGALLRELELGVRQASEVLGPGDIVAPASASGLLDVPVTWSALRATTVIDLDRRFLLATQRWPSLTLNLHRRVLDQAHRSAVHAAIGHLPRVDHRLLAVLWHLAERWGRATSGGTEMTLPLTHQTIGRLVGAQRPTVTLALGELTREGAVLRTATRTWLLTGSPRSVLETLAH